MTARKAFFLCSKGDNAGVRDFRARCTDKIAMDATTQRTTKQNSHSIPVIQLPTNHPAPPRSVPGRYCMAVQRRGCSALGRHH